MAVRSTPHPLVRFAISVAPAIAVRERNSDDPDDRHIPVPVPMGDPLSALVRIHVAPVVRHGPGAERLHPGGVDA
ncbi:hypothetical protein GCM10023307_06750 [Lysobacter hankyongensis]|uniref:Uncharacterized protein n=1 Tax=Lysobacter hankyongensis TaxID=1176535 RepID=A0ABP9AS67_9GAMM